MSDEPLTPDQPPSRKLDEQALKGLIQTALREMASAEGSGNFEVSYSRRHQGPMPTPELAGAYEKMHPGSIAEMFEMARTDQRAYIESRQDVVRRDDRFRITALVFGIAALIVIIGGVVYLAMNNHDTVAGILAGIGVAAVVTAFVNARIGAKRPVTIPNEDEEDEA